MTDPDWIRRLWTRHTGVGHRIENLLKGTAILTTKNLVNIRSVTSAKFLHGLFQRKQMILYGRQS